MSEYSDKDFSQFREAYLFAYDINGMNEGRIGSEQFAKLWMSEYSDRDFNQFTETYLFAYGTMNKGRIGAKQYALSLLQQNSI